MSLFKVGDKVKIVKITDDFNYSGKTIGDTFVVKEMFDGWLRHTKGESCGIKAECCILVKRNGKKVKMKKSKYKVGDRIMNNDASQKSEIVSIHQDNESVDNKYLVRCLDDAGSLHLIDDSDISEIEIKELTVDEIKEYYEENEDVEVKVVTKTKKK